MACTLLVGADVEWRGPLLLTPTEHNDAPDDYLGPMGSSGLTYGTNNTWGWQSPAQPPCGLEGYHSRRIQASALPEVKTGPLSTPQACIRALSTPVHL